MLGDNTKWFQLCILFGLVFELIGAFFLSIEMIGRSRLRAMRKKFFDPLEEIAREKKIKETVDLAIKHNMYKAPTVLVAIVCALGAFSGSLLAISVEALELSDWLEKPLILISILSGGIIGYFGLPALSFLFSKSSTVLCWIEKRAQQRKIGLIGFLVLTFGFLLQVIGIFPSVLSKGN